MLITFIKIIGQTFFCLAFFYYIYTVIKTKHIMAKLTNKNTSGTSFHNSTIIASVNDLIEVLGEPRYQSNDGQDKVNFEWDCETEDGDLFTIYDWKEYRSISKDEQIEWHIGGFNGRVTFTAEKELVELLLN